MLHLPFSYSKVLKVKFSGWLCITQPPMWARKCLLLLPAELIAYLGKAGNPVGLLLLAQKDLDLLCSGNRVITLGIVTQLQLHFRTDIQIHWRQVPRHFWNPYLCKSISVLPKWRYKHVPNWPKLSKIQLSELLMLSENGRRTLQLKFDVHFRYSCMKENRFCLLPTHFSYGCFLQRYLFSLFYCLCRWAVNYISLVWLKI